MIELRKNLFRISKKILLSGNLKWAAEQMIRYVCIKGADLINIPPLTGPIMGSIVVTYRCNCRCPMCNILGKKTGDAELDTQSMIRLIDDFYRLGTTGIAFTGGEPLLRKDIGILIRHAKRKGMIVYLITNGYLLSEERIIDDVLETPPDNINISLDGANSVTHDRSRGRPGTFNTVTEGIRKLVYERDRKKARCIVTLLSVLSRENIGEIEDIYSLGERLGVDALGFIPLHIFKEEALAVSDGLFYKKIESVIEFLISKKKAGLRPEVENTAGYLRMFSSALSGGSLPVRCIAGYASCIADVYGNVYGCWPHVGKAKAIGSIKEKPLEQIWRSAEYARHRAEMKNCRKCFYNCQAELSLMFN